MGFLTTLTLGQNGPLRKLYACTLFFRFLSDLEIIIILTKKLYYDLFVVIMLRNKLLGYTYLYIAKAHHHQTSILLAQ
jgi:hypothetical protein